MVCYPHARPTGYPFHAAAVEYWHKTNGWTVIEVCCPAWKIVGFADALVGDGGYELLREFAERANSLVDMNDLHTPPAPTPVSGSAHKEGEK